MYPEEEVPAESASYPVVRERLAYHFEGLIPLILLIIIAAVVGDYFNFWEIPFVGQFIGEQKPMQMLIIGNPQKQTLDILNQNKDLVVYRIRNAYSLRATPEEILAQYDVVMLDQTGYASNDKKALPRMVGDALVGFVQKGGKLIVVKDSGIYRPGAPELVGWKATIGDIVPVDCVALPNGDPSCTKPINVRGEIWRQDFDHPIMAGIEVIPPMQNQPPLQLQVFDVTPTGNEIAFVQASDKSNWYTAIVEKRTMLGKVIYFNYQPWKTPGVFEKTLKYLRG
jgi:hypothetical protein